MIGFMLASSKLFECNARIACAWTALLVDPSADCRACGQAVAHPIRRCHWPLMPCRASHIRFWSPWPCCEARRPLLARW